MANIQDMINRLDLQEISGYLVGETTTQNCKYEAQLTQETEKIKNRLKSLCPVEDDYNDAFYDLVIALTDHQDVYMEIGMKMGARLIYQLLIKTE